jgi:hypothetical protein
MPNASYTNRYTPFKKIAI